MRQLIILGVCLVAVGGLFVGQAKASEALPGSKCVYMPQSGQPSTTTALIVFITELANTSGSTITVSCPLTTQSTHTTLNNWQATLDGTAAWSAASCNIFWFDASGLTLGLGPSNGIAEGSIGSNRAVIADRTPFSFQGLGGPATMLCNMPPHSTLFGYISSETD